MTILQKLPKNVGDLGKLIGAKGFKKLPKVQKIAQSGHTDGRSSTAGSRGGSLLAGGLRKKNTSLSSPEEVSLLFQIS